MIPKLLIRSSAARFLRRLPSLAVLCALVSTSSATTLPIGPITFGSNAEYDQNFKEPPSAFPAPLRVEAIRRQSNGSLALNGSFMSSAVFDTSTTGGTGGFGGTGGSDTNNDLGNFIIAADFATTSANFGGGFLLRLNSAEAGGYAVTFDTNSTSAMTFTVFENSESALPIFGDQIFMETVSLPGNILPNSLYTFQVLVNGGTFEFNFANGAAKAIFTDPTVTATVGQAGIVLLNPGQTTAVGLDNFRLGALLPGDANNDQLVDGADYTLWADNYLSANVGFRKGDFTGDGIVDGADYVVWADHFAPGPLLLASAVPEPSSLALAGISVIALLAHAWRGPRAAGKARYSRVRAMRCSKSSSGTESACCQRDDCC